MKRADLSLFLVDRETLYEKKRKKNITAKTKTMFSHDRPFIDDRYGRLSDYTPCYANSALQDLSGLLSILSILFLTACEFIRRT